MDDSTLLPSLAHRILTCPAFVTLEYHLLQLQIIRKYNDMKVIETLCYALQAQLQLRGSTPLAVQYDVALLRDAFKENLANWKGVDDWRVFDDVDGRECVWSMIGNSCLIDGKVDFSYPNNIAGVGRIKHIITLIIMHDMNEWVTITKAISVYP